MQHSAVLLLHVSAAVNHAALNEQDLVAANEQEQQLTAYASALCSSKVCAAGAAAVAPVVLVNGCVRA